MISISPVSPHEWPTYRDLRLRALRDSPDAFGSTFESESQRTDENWAARIAAAAADGNDRAFFAFHGDAACGLVWCKLSAAEPGAADLYQMWVDPASRGLGAGSALLKAALAWAASAAVHQVRLGVTLADTPAMRLYQAHGFQPVGAPEPLREGSSLLSQAMECQLSI
ncbi:GNAT family N-acetyltransferase [Pseudomonas tructae]|uniref:GNAT family N-acetyltransferase n=1 Tax=Pseudomonas tructae TaxID=2518644 RepID=A0A411MI73_9PSED|nr:GNAT family N-acetyltransferase [Pseudomonas tructae]QBF26369.1 GNAT family N-acetyltransferase [Pseudomonas tructae]